jgi:hypothetical protein
MKSDMKTAELLEDEYSHAITPSFPRLSNNFIPQDTEVTLEVGKSVADIESGEQSQDVRIPRWENWMKQVAGDME